MYRDSAAPLNVQEQPIMPYRSMSLEEFARHVGMDVRDVCDLADKGKLPGQKVGGQWRFNRARVTEWLQQEMRNLDESRLLAVERAMRGAVAEDIEDVQDRDMVVTGLIPRSGVDLALPARTRSSVLRELIALANKTGLLYDGSGLLAAIEERESMCSTALPNGLAIPHARQPMPYATGEPVICVARVYRGIPFGAPDHELTRLFLLICCHDDRYHLHVLARLVRMLADDKLLDQLMEVEERDEFLHLLIKKERELSELLIDRR